MDIHYQFELESQVLVVTTSGGRRSPQDTIAMGEVIGNVANRHQRERILWLDATTGRPFSVLESHVAGEATAQALRGFAVAYVPLFPIDSQLRQRLNFVAAVAQNRGLRGQIWLEEAAAREWLLAFPSSYFTLCGW